MFKKFNMTLYLLYKASKRQSGASGGMHRTVTGEWVWSEEEETQAAHGSSDEETDTRPMNELTRADSSGSDNEKVTYSVWRSCTRMSCALAFDRIPLTVAFL